MKLRTSLLAASVALSSLCSLRAETNGMAEFLKTKYGFFVHYVWGGSPDKRFTITKDGKVPENFDEMANAFDVEGFANDLSRWGVEYVILTAWHYNINPLFPSETMKKWGLDHHYCKRDVLREVINACKAKGIKVMLYTHPRDGHDLNQADQTITGWGGPNGTDPQWEKFDKKKWNDFTNDLYKELIERYGDDIIGIFSDEGSGVGDSWRVVDYPRLRHTVKSLQPDLLMEQNWYGTTYSLDVGCKEYSHWGEFANRDGNAWPAWRMPVGTTFTPSWWASKPAAENAVYFKAEDMYRYSILLAGANHEGGGIQWAAGNFAGGGWETGVDETMTKMAEWLKPVAQSIKKTYASTSWETPQGTKIPDLKWGGVATRAINDAMEFVHILTPPADGARTVQLPPPADGKKFARAVLLNTRKAAGLVQDENGVKLTLPDGENWNPLHTVFALQVAPDSPEQNLAMWKAFRGSSFPDPGPKQSGTAWAFAAVDGDPATAWNSRPEGPPLDGDMALPADTRPNCQIDLGLPASLSRIEIAGNIGPDVAVFVSESASFTNATPVAVSKSDAPEGPKLEILRATYGAGDQRTDVTEKLRGLANGGILKAVANNDLAGADPALSQQKELRVEYTLDGKAATVTVGENQALTLGFAAVWKIDLPAGTRAQFVRVARQKDGPPLSIAELRAFGKFH